jgi:uncharacterized DUF497 family protein
MLDLTTVVGFEWDEGDRRKSADKHVVSQPEAEQVFADKRVLLALDQEHSAAEMRFHALGMTATGRLLQVTFTLRHSATKIRVISARPMNRKEKSVYEEKSS